MMGASETSKRAILLDAAGTLIRPREPVSETYAGIARDYGMDLDIDKLARVFKSVFRAMPELAFKWASLEELHEQERAWWRLLVRRVIDRTGTFSGDFDEYFAALYAHYAQGDAWRCFPEVPDVLASLRDNGYRLAVVSNFDSRLPGILRAVGIDAFMDAIIYSSRAGSAKPDPAIFLQALDALGIAPEQALHVGDSVEADLGGAMAAGLAALLIRRDQLPVADSEPVIHSLADLASFFGVGPR